MVADGDAKQEIATHWRGYSLFTRLMTWGAAVSLLVALIVILIISD